MTPMAPGSQPNDYTNEASTTQTSEKKSSEQSSVPQHHVNSPPGQGRDYPDITQYPDRVSQDEHLPDTQQGASSQPSPRPRESISTAEYPNSQTSPTHGSQSQAKQQPPVPLFAEPSKQPSHSATNLQTPPKIPDVYPNVVLNPEYIESLHSALTQKTSGFSVEQLEQINTSLMDCVWRMRGEWDRNRMTAIVIETFNEVLKDMQEMQEIGPISQQTREQMGASF